jgi:hypothetical protein
MLTEDNERLGEDTDKGIRIERAHGIEADFRINAIVNIESCLCTSYIKEIKFIAACIHLSNESIVNFSLEEAKQRR